MDIIDRKNTFQNIHRNKVNFFQKEKTQLMLEKIKLDDNPEFKDFLHTYFNDPSKYFLKKFKNNPIVVGRKTNKNTFYKIKVSIKESPLKKSRKNLTKSIIDLKNKSLSDHSYREENKGNAPKDNNNNNNNININYLKAGQRYVNDLEINTIFSNFKNTQKANKNKINNIITIKDIRKFRAENLDTSKSVKGRMLMRRKTLKSFKGLNSMDNNNNITNNDNNNNINSYNNKISITENNISNNSIKKTSTQKLTDKVKKTDNTMASNDSLQDKKNNKNINNLKLYHNNINTFKDRTFSNESNSISNKNISKTNDSNKKIKNIYNRDNSNDDKVPISDFYKFHKLYKTLKENNKIDIFKKQAQYLSTEKCRVYRKELANILVSQEKTFLNNLDSENKARKIAIYMSNKLKIPKDKLLMNKTEFYRINNDLKSRLSKQMEYEYIEDFYEWEKNLKNFGNKIQYEEIIRDPIYKINNYPKRNFYSMNNEYLTKRINKKNLKKFFNNLDNIKYNFRGLFVKGKNLLEVEQDLAKGIKGKKILNNFEEVLPYSSLKNDVYAKHFQL